jgi:hypothetical protein
MKIKTLLNVFPGILAIIICFFLLGGCNKTADGPDSFTFDKDASYAFGMFLGSQVLIPGVHYDYKSFMEGFRAYNEMGETKFSMEEAELRLNAVYDSLRIWLGMYMQDMYMPDQWSSEDLERYRQDGIVFLAENARNPGVTILPSGLQYEVISQGDGAKPAFTDTVQVHYEGMLIDGTVFNSSYAWGMPVEFPLNEVISGWSEGLQLMNEGGTYIFYIPFELGYGPAGIEGIIPGYSTLIFKVDLLSIVR